MSSGTAPTPFQPPNQAGAASSLQGAATSLTSLGNTTTGTAVPGYQSIYQNTVSNPYYGQAQAGAGQTAQTGGQFGQSEVNNAYGLQALGNSLGQYAPGIAATAFDPQNQLYNQQQQVNNQQQNAINAQNGVAGSPFGAGLAGESNQNFNINWQNNQQQRENAGVAALGSLAQTQSGLQTAAGALDTSYLGIGQQASQNALASWQAQQNADNAFWNGIGTMASDAGGIFKDFKPYGI